MKRQTFALLLMVSACGCTPSPDAEMARLASECFAEAAYDAYRAGRVEPKPHAKCCDACKGTGKVRSGDGIAWVACPCPDTCGCKKK